MWLNDSQATKEVFPVRLRSLLAAALLLLSGPVLAAGKCEMLVATGNPEHPPFLWRDPADPQRLLGAEAELLAELGRRLDIRVELLAVASAAAAEQEVASGRMDLLLGSQLADEGLTRFDYLYPAYARLELQVWTLADKAPLLGRLEDLASHRGRLLGQSALPAALAAHLKLRTARPEQALSALRSGALDYVVIEQALGRALLPAGEQDVLALSPALSSHPLQLALSHNSACNDGWLRGRLAVELRQLVRDGEFERMLGAAVELWREQH